MASRLVLGEIALAAVYLSGYLIIELSMLSFHSIQPTPREVSPALPRDRLRFECNLLEKLLVTIYRQSRPRHSSQTESPVFAENVCSPSTILERAILSSVIASMFPTIHPSANIYPFVIIPVFWVQNTWPLRRGMTIEESIPSRREFDDII